ncbi:S8 family serine peptidase [Cellulomonas sp. ATA003]|uniref:S8 family peptidase n=1 Tax=Cellulomonas sp. ATA003 TaxID=3073064 RepID=UPI002872B30E|nr:S8 family serine peptidase [Cellulomonas sp. ATA003]WNB84682.1 S8 family serine peptidase [Cellulomonas sp. ATA003]
MAAAVSASAVLCAVMVPTTASGAAVPAALPGPLDGITQLPLTGPDGQRSDFQPAGLDPDRLVTVMLEVAGEPVAGAQAQALDAGGELPDSQRAALRSWLERRQAPIREAVEELDGRVLAAMQDAYNGVKASLPHSALSRVAALPDVVAVHAVPTVERTNDDSVPFLDIPQEVWEDLGATGEGVTVGIIDSGIDYTHAAFGGPGTAEAYAANDPAVVEEGTFPTAKVVGGHDFVGDAYDPGAGPTDPASVPAPDPDPLDCDGHGTHVAGTAAGMGVLTDGSTYTGPYDASTHDVDFEVGPGVAPQALLYALKVFGCEGGTDVVAEAVDWAVAHDLDVINLSLGSDFSALGDAGVAAIDNAARAGTVPVLAAGNSGDITYIVGSPGTAERALSVAALDTVASYPAALLTAGDTELQLQVSNAVDIPDPATGPLVVLDDDPATPADESLGCAAADYADLEDGAVVVTVRGVCPRVDRAILGQEAGAAAVVMVNDSGLPPIEGPIAGVTIPFLGATPEQGEQLAALDGEQATVTASDPLPNPGFRRSAGFSSAGPALTGDTAKPDVAAPGVSIVSAAVGTGTGGRTSSGTSMASPTSRGSPHCCARPGPGWRSTRSRQRSSPRPTPRARRATAPCASAPAWSTPTRRSAPPWWPSATRGRRACPSASGSPSAR